MQDFHIEIFPAAKLVACPQNARTHSDEQIEQIAASIRGFGWTNPILVGSDNVLIAGHARLLAAQRLGMYQVPVIVLSHLNDSQRRALMIADNQLALNAGWDDDLLRAQLLALQKDEFDLNLIGFEAEELAQLLAAQHAGDGLADEDAVPELQEEPVSATGDLWLLGDHSLLVGDATNLADVDTLMASDKADLVFTDPPYNVD